MIRSRIPAPTAATLALVVGLAGCKKADQTVCTTIGRSGGMLQSYDTVLSIAIQPEALDSDERLCISPTDAPPDVFGAAYVIDPPQRLNYDAVVSYRGALPDDLTDVNVGRISERDFNSGKGAWVSLNGCRVEEVPRHVQCADPELSKFYGLLDRVLGNTDDTLASASSGGTGDVTTSEVTTTIDPDTDSGPTPIDYPPECDDLQRGPYEVISVGTLFDQTDTGGAEDMAPDGHGGFVARSGTRLVRLNVTGGTLGTPNDPGFTVSELLDSPLFNSATLGLRYAPSGDLILAQGEDDQLRAMDTEGTLTTLLERVNLPNGVYVGTDGVAWYTEFLNNRVWRLDLAGGVPVQMAMVDQPNGVVFDPLREMLFYVSFGNGDLWQAPIAADGTAGTPVLVAPLGGSFDGLSMDVCGNLYGVDNNNGGPARLVRVFMNDDAVMSEVEEIATGLGGALANAVFGVGEEYGDFQTAMFMTGVPGEIYYVDVHITGAAVPAPAAAPATVDDPPDTTGTSDGSTSGGSSSTGTSSATG